MSVVKIYTTPTCVFCKMAKDYFQANKIEYQEFNVAKDAKARDEMIQKSGQLGVPVIDVNGKIVLGFNKPKLQELLSLKK